MGYSLDLGGMNAPGIHYNVVGTGRAVFGNRDPIPLMPHTLIIVPPNSPFRIEVEGSMGFTALRSVKKQPQMTSSSTIRRFSAGDGDPFPNTGVRLLYATYGACADLFAGLTEPIFEQFDVDDHVDTKPRQQSASSSHRKLAAVPWEAALLKQVIVLLLRRSLVSMNAWVSASGAQRSSGRKGFCRDGHASCR